MTKSDNMPFRKRMGKSMIQWTIDFPIFQIGRVLLDWALLFGSHPDCILLERLVIPERRHTCNRLLPLMHDEALMVRVKPQGFAELGGSLRPSAEAEMPQPDEIAAVYLVPFVEIIVENQKIRQ